MFDLAVCLFFMPDALPATIPKGICASSGNQTRDLSLDRQMCKSLHCGG